MDPRYDLHRHKYQLFGNHGASKLCHWARQSVKGKGGCYKQQFYGIESHRCVQMTPCVDVCNHRCLFCWRPTQHTITKLNDPDSPELIFEGMLAAQKIMLDGYGGVPRDIQKFKEAQDPKHVAISLSGEPTMYPFLSELIALAHKRKMTTFVVTNGTQPETLKKLKPLPTQLYVTLPAPDKETYKKICVPLVDGWEAILQTLELLPRLKTRTAVRLTLVDGWNFHSPEKYAELISIGQPWFIEAKAYMNVGFSVNRLGVEAMPHISKIQEFSQKLGGLLGYHVSDSHVASRVCLLEREDVGSKRFIFRDGTGS